MYDDVIADLLLDAGRTQDDTDVEAEATAAFLVERLGLTSGDRVFDQCAGTGRLSIPLARRGLIVESVEQAASYVERARARALDGNLPVHAVAGDAFDYVPGEPCRGAFNWWTSFGYLEDDEGNLRMLRRAFEALERGGKLALDFLHMPQVLRSFRPTEVTRRGELVLVRETTLDLSRGLMHKTWRVGDNVKTSTVRAYYPHELVALARAAGFVEPELVGSVAGEPLGLDSARCILIARRP